MLQPLACAKLREDRLAGRFVDFRYRADRKDGGGHRFIFAASSEFFAAWFEATPDLPVDIPFNPEGKFEDFIDFLYSDSSKFSQTDPSSYFRLWALGSFYGANDAKHFAKHCLFSRLQEVSSEGLAEESNKCKDELTKTYQAFCPKPAGCPPLIQAAWDRLNDSAAELEKAIDGTIPKGGSADPDGWNDVIEYCKRRKIASSEDIKALLARARAGSAVNASWNTWECEHCFVEVASHVSLKHWSSSEMRGGPEVSGGAFICDRCKRIYCSPECMGQKFDGQRYNENNSCYLDVGLKGGYTFEPSFIYTLHLGGGPDDDASCGDCDDDSREEVDGVELRDEDDMKVSVTLDSGSAADRVREHRSHYLGCRYCQKKDPDYDRFTEKKS